MVEAMHRMAHKNDQRVVTLDIKALGAFVLAIEFLWLRCDIAISEHRWWRLNMPLGSSPSVFFFFSLSEFFPRLTHLASVCHFQFRTPNGTYAIISCNRLMQISIYQFIDRITAETAATLRSHRIEHMKFTFFLWIHIFINLLFSGFSPHQHQQPPPNH